MSAKKPPVPSSEFNLSEFVSNFIASAQIPATASVSQEESLISVELQTESPALIIGFHGETLSALERLLSLAIEKATGTWTKVSINVGDYRQKREETLKNLALNALQRVRFSSQPWSLPPLSASERRQVHVILSEYPEVVTESEGEGPSRRVVVKPAK